LVNAPPGIIKTGITNTNSTQAAIGIDFNGPDFDIDYRNFYVSISYSVLNLSISDLATNSDTIFAFVENPSALLTSDAPLTESTLDSRTLYINLSEEYFIVGINMSHFTLVNAPPGLSIYSLTRPSNTQAILDLQFNGTDFDINYPNFAVDINSAYLYSTKSGYLRTNSENISTYIENPVAILICDTTVLTERRLDYRTLYINLTEERFNNYTILTTSNFTLLNGPPGLSIESVTGISPTRADINLQFYGDFDVSYPNFRVSMPEAILYQTTIGTLVTNSFPISNNVETPSATVTPDATLAEQTLGLRTLTINLTEEEFHKDSVLRPTNFILNNRPAGLTIGSVTRVTRRIALLDLEFDGTDFDDPITNFYVTINKDILLQSHSNLQTQNQLSISAHNENPVCTIFADPILTENLLNNQNVYLSLADEHFINYTSLTPANFSLLNAPAGLSVESVSGTSPTEARIDLAFTYTDFDVDYPNFKVVIDRSVLFYSKTSDLTSNNLLITHHLEIPVATLDHDSTLTERRINERTLYIDLIEEAFRNYTTLLPANFTLVNRPNGLTIQAVRGISPNRAEIDLQFDGTDFDVNYYSFAVDINYSVLVQTLSGNLRTSPDTIYASMEIPVAALSADSVLTELRLDYRTLTINLTDERFKNYTVLQISNFTLANYPPGLSIQSVSGLSPTRVEIGLQFNGTDFDIAYTNFRVNITSSVLVQTPSGSLTSTPLSILGYVEKPEATLIQDSILTEKRLDYRYLTITLEEESFRNYATLQPSNFNLINGPSGLSVQSVTGLSPTSARIYLQFDGTDFDTDITNFYINIPYTVLVQTTTGFLSTSQLNIRAYLEQPVATLSSDSILTEERLDFRTLTINLTEERFINYLGLQPSNFALINNPPGLSIQSVIPVSPVRVQLALQFNGTDFETNITNFHITISAVVLYQTKSGTLATNNLTIFALIENPTAILTADSILTEQRLDARFLTIDLVQDNFKNYTTLNVSNFTLVNGPAGLSIQSVTGISPYRVNLNLQFIYTDFDINYPDFHVNIDHSVLYQTTSGVLSSSNLNILAYVEHPIATLTSDTTVLTEQRLDARTLIINLSDEEFLNYTGLQTSNFTLLNAPPGLSVQSVTGVSKTQALLQLQFNGTDFDIHFTNFRVQISRNILQQSRVSDLISTPLTILAYIEQPVAIMTSDSLKEYNLDSRALTINLTDENFINYNSLVIADFILNNKPTGLSIESVQGISPTRVILNLAFVYNDFDADISVFSVTIAKSKLHQSATNLTTNTLWIYAYIEVPVLNAVPDSAMHEYTLGRRSLNLSLSEERFLNYMTLTTSNFYLVNAPAGLTIESVSGLSPITAIVNLAYSGADIDQDITNMRVAISRYVLLQSKVTDLYSNNLTVYRYLEHPVCTIEADAELYELTLGDRYLNLTLTEERFINYQSIVPANFQLINRPAGLTIESVSGLSPTSARINLNFDRTDFDVNYPNFAVRISRNILFQSTSADLTSNNLLINARVEVPSAVITADSSLDEYRLNWRTLDLRLTDERFISQPAVIPSQFTLVNAPQGLTIEQITWMGEQRIIIALAFDGTDFDVPISGFRISINPSILVQSTGNLQTNALNIPSNIEPVVQNVIIPNMTMKVGDQVGTIINVENDHGFIYTLRSGTIGGYPLTNLQKVNNTTYQAVFVVTEGGDDYLESEDIPVRNLQLYNGLVPGIVRNQLIIQNNDLLDASTPAIIRVSALSSGKKNIGSSIDFLVLASETNCVFTESSLINNVPFSSPNIIPTEEAFGNYLINYTIMEGDQNVTEGNLAIRLFLQDGAGNISSPCTQLATNNISIDAAPPLISRAYISSDDDNINVGEKIEVTVIADQPGYAVSSQTWVNGVYISSPNLEFYDNNDGTYLIEYTVEENDGSVSAGQLSVNIILIDSYLNENLPYTTLDANNLTIFTKKPSAAISGTSSICYGDSIALTISFGGGYPPWEIELNTGIGTDTIRNITDSIFLYFISPTTTSAYTIKKVTNATGNSNIGIGTALITVNPLPVARFSVPISCINRNGGTVRFINESDTSQAISHTWQWDFDDPSSGIYNTSNKKNPTHFYSTPELKNVSLIVTNSKGCSDTFVSPIILHPIPEADFIWSSECLTTNDIVFTGTEKLFADDLVSTREWKFYDLSGSLADISAEEKPHYQYDSPETYAVEYKITTNWGCSDTIRKEITLYPIFNIAEGSYYHDFETQPAGWSSKPLTGTRNSWKWSSVSDARFPYTASSGSMAWYTSLPQPEAVENSAVISPCFSFENVTRPLIMIDIKRSMDRDQEGAVVQYTYDNGKTWKNVGKVNKGGLNWYNSTRINNGPAGQSTGWTEATTGGEDTGWITTAHHLDDLVNKKEVRFRIAYGSRGDNTIRNEGFSFDNFHIGQRTKVAVMEYFTSANESKCVNPDNLVNTLANNLYKDIIDIQYHTSYPSADRMNLDNPTPASSRGLYYGVSSIPYALIDGDGYDTILGHERSYNFSTRSPDSTDILVRALLNTDFHIELEINQLSPVIQVTVTIKALKDIPLKELTLHTIVQEVLINDPLYIGINGVTKFENVARMMLPDASGTTFKKLWLKGETEVIIITWNELFDYLNEDNIAITVFLQDYNTKEILQAAGYSPEERPTPLDGISGYDGHIINIYPNPAEDIITIDLGMIPENQILIKLFDLSGKCMLIKQIPLLQEITTLSLEDLSHGLYIIEIREQKKSGVIYHGKIVIN
jgi:hypothetical protein